LSDLSSFLEEEIAAGSFPGGSALVGSSERVLAASFAGNASVVPEPDPLLAGTLFDLASLTKPLVSGALAHAAVGAELDLASPPGRFFPGWKKTRYDGITLEHLLTHTAGLPAWFPLYARGEGVAAYRRTLAEMEPCALAGSEVLYSDLGMLVFGEVLEAFFAAPIDRSFAEHVVPVSGTSTGACYLPAVAANCAATEEGDATERRMAADLGLSYPRFRTGVVRGEVHDGNAFRRGGVSAHAGLFATAEDVWQLARPWLDPARRDFTRDRTPGLAEARGIAWQGARGARSLSESGDLPPRISERAFGHTGFTGTSVWIDPENDRIYLLLTNRVHPRAEGDFNAVRRRFHARVAAGEW
jgi:CubicO group peptidase (beta-lactamase class C family)